MKRRMIVCITLAAILLVVGAAYWAFCRLPHLTGSTIKNADSYLLDAQYMNGTDGHTMTLNAGDVPAIRFETEKGALHLEIQAPDGGVLYSGNGQNAPLRLHRKVRLLPRAARHILKGRFSSKENLPF